MNVLEKTSTKAREKMIMAEKRLLPVAKKSFPIKGMIFYNSRSVNNAQTRRASENICSS